MAWLPDFAVDGNRTVSLQGDLFLRFRSFSPRTMTGSRMGLGLIYRSDKPQSAVIVNEGERLQNWHLPVLDEVEILLKEAGDPGIHDDDPEELNWTTGWGDNYSHEFPSGGCEAMRATRVHWAPLPGNKPRFLLKQASGGGTSYSKLQKYEPNGEVVSYVNFKQVSSGGGVTKTYWRPQTHYDPHNNTSTYEYDDTAGGRLTKITGTRGISVELAWGANNVTVSYKKGGIPVFLSPTWSFSWNASSLRVETLTRPPTTYVKVGQTGPLMDVVNPLTDSRVYTFTYHTSGVAQGKLYTVSDSRFDEDPASSVILANTYDNVQGKVRVTEQADQHGRIHGFSYAAGSPLTTTYTWEDEPGKNASAIFEVNANGFADKITIIPGSKPRLDNNDTPEPAQLVWQYVYSSCSTCGQPTRITTPSGLTADMTYDSYGNMTSWTSKNPGGTGDVTYGWSWHGPEYGNRPISYTPPGGAAAINYTYGTWVTRPEAGAPEGENLWGYMPTYVHVETTPISLEGGGNHSVSLHFELDAYGRIETFTDSGGRLYSYLYETAGPGHKLLKSITRQPIPNDAAYQIIMTHDDVGRVTKIGHGTSGNMTEYNLSVGPYGRPHDISVQVATGVTYTTKLAYDPWENLAVVRKSNLDHNGQTPKYDDGSGSPRTWVRNESHYYYDRLLESYIDRRPLPDPADPGNPLGGSNPWMARYALAYKTNGDLKEVTLPNGTLVTFQSDGYRTLYRAIADPTGLNVELGRQYFDNDLVLFQHRRKLTDGPSPTFAITQYIRNHGGLGALHKIVDPTGITTELTRNALGWITDARRQQAGSGNTHLHRSYVHDEIGRVKQVHEHLVGTASAKAVTKIRYNVRSQAGEITDDLGRKVVREYDGYGRLTRARDNLVGANNTNAVELKYVQGRNFVAESIIRLFEESDDDSPPSGTSKAYHTTYAHDLLGRVIQASEKGLSGGQTPLVQTFGHDSLGNLSFFKAPHQQADNDWYSRSAFDARGRWVEFVKRIGAGGGDRIRLTAGHVDHQSTTSVTRLDGRGFQTKHAYDAGYRLVDVFRPGYTTGQAHRTTFAYDAASRAKTITDGNSNVIDQVFDAAGRLTTRNVTLGPGVSVLSDKEVYAYDEIGRLRDQHSWWAGGSLLVGGSTLSRDGMGRVTNEVFYYSGIDLTSPVNISSGYTYSGSTAVGDPTFRRTLTYSSGANVQSVPDTVRRLKDRFFTPAGGAESLLGRYRYVGGITLHREQFYAGTSNKMVTDLSFDGYHRLTDLDHKLNGGASTHLEQYVWDAGSNLLKRKYPKQDGSAGDAYAYDKYDRLTGAKLGVSSGEIDNDYSQITSSAKEIAYALDPGNNRSSVTVTLSQQAQVVTSYTTEPDSPRYQDITGVAPPPLYDGEGNLVWDGTNYMVYDFRNRLSEVYQVSEGAMSSSQSSSSSTSSSSPRTQLFPVRKQDLEKARDEILRTAEGDLWTLLKEDPQEARATLKTDSGSGGKKGGPSVGWNFPRRSGELVLVALYTYDTYNRRIARQVALPSLSVDQRFAYDGWREVEELVPETVGESTQAVAKKVFVWGRELDELLAYQRKEGGNWVSYYPVQDRRESVVKLLDSQGNLVENVEYDPYGKGTVYVGGSPQASSSVENPYLYQGRRVDPETGFVYMRNRYLHTAWGRFLSVDPLGSWTDRHNLGNGYAFVGDRPTMLVDLWGLQTKKMTTWDLTIRITDPPRPLVTTFGNNSQYVPDQMPRDIDWADVGEFALEVASLGLEIGLEYLADEFTFGGYGVAEAAINGTDPLGWALIAAGMIPFVPNLNLGRKAVGKCPRSLPLRGKPNSSGVLDRGNGKGQIRDYGPDGNAQTDYDFGHHPELGEPHAHDWDWSDPDKPKRGPGRPLKPGE